MVGEELGVLPGMDSIFPALVLEKLVHFLPRVNYRSRTNFDIVVYDGISSEETLRLIGATERARYEPSPLRLLELNVHCQGPVYDS